MKEPVKGIKNNPLLSNSQILFLEEFSKSELKDVYRLTGGTVLSAFYLGHRYSDDLDFFSDRKLPFYLIEEFLKSLNFIISIEYTKVFDRNIFSFRLTDGSLLKTEFTYYPLENLEPAVKIDGLNVDGFLDIVVNKLCAIADRSDAKDYVDVYFALKLSNLGFTELLKLAEKKCNIRGIKHIIRSRLLQVPDGVDKLQMKLYVKKEEIEDYLKARVRETIVNEL